MGKSGSLPANLVASFSWKAGDGKISSQIEGAALHDVHRYMIDQIDLKVHMDGVYVGDISLEPQGDDWVISSVNVIRKMQRKGVATWMLSQMQTHLDEHHLDTTIHHNPSLTENGLDWALKIDQDSDAMWRQENADRIDGRMREQEAANKQQSGQQQSIGQRPVSLSNLDDSAATLEAQADAQPPDLGL